VEPPPPSAGRRSRLIVVGGAVLVLVALVAFASRSGFGSAKTAPTQGFANWAFSMFVVLFVLAIPATIWVYFFSGERPVRRKERSPAATAIRTIAIVAIVLLGVAGYTYLHRHHVFHGWHVPKFAGSGHGRAGRHGAQQTHPIAFQWPVALVGVVLCLAALAMWLSLRRYRKPYVPIPLGDGADGLAADVAHSISDAIDDLEAEPDARRAVIAAYARMEGVLARSGLRRGQSETALEYLERVLLGLTTRGDAVRSLTGLFQEARFSTHAIDGTMKQAAIVALSTIRDDLQATT
jgi:hypothetical protein